MATRIPSDNIEDAYPLSRLQAGMLFHSAYSPETDAAIYHDLFSFHLRGPCDEPSFRAAAAQLSARHPALRTSFDLINFSQPLQLVHRSVEIPLGVEDLRALSPAEQETHIAAWTDAEKTRHFDWSQPPLLRFHIHLRSESTFQFMVSFHHAILDGWSMASMLTELFHLYLARLGRNVPPVPPAPRITFREFVAEEQKAIQSDEHRNYWLEKLKDSTVLMLPRWPGGPEADSRRQVHRHDVSLSGEVCDGLKRLAQAVGCPLKSVLLAGHVRVLKVVSGQSDIVTGFASNGRPEETDGERVLGLFLNTLPLRLQAPGGTWKDLVHDAYRAEQELLPFRKYPLAELQKLKGSQSLFEAAFSYVHFHVYQGLSKFEDIEPLSREVIEETNFTLVAIFKRDVSSSRISLSLMYDSLALRPAQVEAIGRYYAETFRAMADDPLGRYEVKPALPPAEQQQILHEWNTTQADYPSDRCLHELFERQARLTPEAPAVIFEDQSLTYEALNQRASRLAHYLRTLGVGPEIRVGLCLDRSADFVVALLGVLKAGGVYVPLDPAYPSERIAYMLADSAVPVLLTQETLLDELPAHPVYPTYTVCLDADWPDIAQSPSSNPEPLTTPDNLAYVIYTSGSTGQPKGVMVAHRGVCNLVQAQRDSFDVQPASQVLQFAALSFDAAVSEVFVTLLAGATLHLAPREVLLPGPSLVQLLRDRAITTVTLPPSALGVLPVEELPALRSLIVAGEACTAELAARWAPGRRFLNAYGPTESSVCATMAECRAGAGKPPIGRPILNTQVYILDSHLQPAPVGTPGELYIGGAGLARGYLNRPDLTADRFVPNPFLPDSSELRSEPQHDRRAATDSGRPSAGSRLYKTGDLARYLPDGSIEYLGRTDQQVKIRGFRVELGEIEAALARHAAVAEAAVAALSDESGHRRLVAYVVPRPEPRRTELTSSMLRSYLQQSLPDYMLPAAFVMLEKLPLAPSGKVDRRALPAPESTRPRLEREFVAPRSPMEQTLASIWAEVLRLERVGVHDNFFELGGDSILSLQIAIRANRFGLQIAPKLLFDHETIAELAEAVGAPVPANAEQGPVTGPVPLTPIQHWFFEQNLCDPHHFNQSVLLEVPAALEPARVEQVLQHLVQHHDALRLRFVHDESGWNQVNAAVDGAPILTHFDLPELSGSAQVSALESAAAQLQASLNLAGGPLVRAGLFNFGPYLSGRLLIAIHHLAVDAVSWRILLEDLQVGYQQLSRGEPVQFASKTTAFKHWAERLVEYAQSEALQTEAPYWLAVAPPSLAPLPVDNAGDRSRNTKASARSLVVGLNVEETEFILREMPAIYQTHINDVLLTALAQAFRQWTGAPSLLVDLEGHGREEILDGTDISRTVGWFTTVFPVPLSLPEAGDLASALASVKEHLGRIPNRGIGYGLLRYLGRRAEVAQQLKQMPQAEVSFNYLGQLDQVLPETSPFQPGRESGGPGYGPRASRRHLLEVNGFVVGGRLQVRWTYHDAFHRPDTIEHLARQFVAALQALIAHAQSTGSSGYNPADFPEASLSEEKLDKVLAELDLNSVED